jgi:hypothetical protein
MSDEVGPRTLALSLCLLALGILTGWLLTSKVAGPDAGSGSLSVCLVVSVLTFTVQLIAYFFIRNRLKFIPGFYAAFGLDLT